MIIGIQCGRGSANERACNEFCRKRNISNYQIKYLISTENVLKELNQGKIDLGTFAIKSSRAGLVKETQEAIKKYPFEKIDEIDLEIDHAFLGVKRLNKEQYHWIISPPHGLKEHKEYINKQYPNAKLIKLKDIALAARRLKKGKYDCNTLIISLKECAKIYQLEIIEDNLPTNKGYITTFYLVKKSSASNKH
nr:hypothetical protein [uncultured archaeon]